MSEQNKLIVPNVMILSTGPNGGYDRYEYHLWRCVNQRSSEYNKLLYTNYARPSNSGGWVGCDAFILGDQNVEVGDWYIDLKEYDKRNPHGWKRHDFIKRAHKPIFNESLTYKITRTTDKAYNIKPIPGEFMYQYVKHESLRWIEPEVLNPTIEYKGLVGMGGLSLQSNTDAAWAQSSAHRTYTRAEVITFFHLFDKFAYNSLKLLDVHAADWINEKI